MKYIYSVFYEKKYQPTEQKKWLKPHHFNILTSLLLMISCKFRVRYLNEVYGWYFDATFKNYSFRIAWSRIFQDFKKLFKKKAKYEDDGLPF